MNGTLSTARAKKGKEKVKAPALLLANVYDDAVDPKGWWMSEKLDGVRAHWDPKAGVVVSRQGNAFPVPKWFLDGLPTDVSLDGELFLERGEFSKTVSIGERCGSRGVWAALD